MATDAKTLDFMNKLRKTRRVLAVAAFALITLLFLDFTGTLHTWLGWLARIQFLPALLALNVGVVAALLLLTLVFGRVYCSIICPLGVMQDIISWLSGKRKKRKYRFSYSPAKRWLRLGMLAVMAIAIAAGIGSIAALLAPYSAYGRIAQNLMQPVYILSNNGLALVAEHANSYAFYSRDVWMRSIPTFAIAAASFIAIAVLAWRNGRTYCNTICPVGTVLGYVARFSWLKVRVDTNKCNGCGLCARSCKASCIDSKTHTIDYTRCVTCGNCLDQCRRGALSYGHTTAESKPAADPAKSDKKEEGATRRTFLLGTALAAGSAVYAQEKKKVDGGIAAITEKEAPKRTTAITPPGSISALNMARHCTACQLCVAECPNDVLRPSTDLGTLMQPVMSYERGYCRPECTRCSEVCPAGAIKPITAADKSAIQVGHAVWTRANCVPITDGVECGNCARHCPTGAIQMVPSEPGNDAAPMIPAINTAKCIGCGACENLCPSRPFSAIHVEGHEMHKTI